MWTILAWTLTAVAAGLLGFAVLGGVILRRVRPRRRCPHCRYDLAGTEGRRCPECGRTAKRERHLYRVRRRTRAAVLAVVLFIAATPAFRSDQVRAHGWMGGVPSWVLIVTLPLYDTWVPDESIVPRESPPTRNETLGLELRRRCETNALSAREWRLLIAWLTRFEPHAPSEWTTSGQCLGSAFAHGHLTFEDVLALETYCAITVHVAPTWRDGDEIVGSASGAFAFRMYDAEIIVTNRHSGREISRHVIPARRPPTFGELGILPARVTRGSPSFFDQSLEPDLTLGTAHAAHPTLELAVDVRLREDAASEWITLAELPRDVPLTIVETARDARPFRRSRSIEQALREQSDPVVLANDDGTFNLSLRTIELEHVLRDDAIDALAVRFVLLSGETAVAEGAAHLRNEVDDVPAHDMPFCGPLWALSTTHGIVTLHSVADAAPLSAAHELRVRIETDPTLALRSLRRDVCWDGAVDVPVTLLPDWNAYRAWFDERIEDRIDDR